MVSSTVYMYSNGAMVMESTWNCTMESIWNYSMESNGIIPWSPYGLFHGVHMDYSMESMVDMPAFHMESSGIHKEWCWIPHGMMNSMTIP